MSVPQAKEGKVLNLASVLVPIVATRKKDDLTFSSMVSVRATVLSSFFLFFLVQGMLFLYLI